MRRSQSKTRIRKYILFSILTSLTFYCYPLYFPSPTGNVNAKVFIKDQGNLQYSGNRSANYEPKAFIAGFKNSMHTLPDQRFVTALINYPKTVDPMAAKSNYIQQVIDENWVISKDGSPKFTLHHDFGPKEFQSLSEITLRELFDQKKFSLEVGSNPRETAQLRKDIDSFEYPLVLAALEQLNKMNKANPKDFEIFRLITKGTTILALHTSSYFVNNLALESKALALFMVLKFNGVDRVKEEEALIAYMLGYRTYLAESVSKLVNKGAFEFVLSRNLIDFEKYISERKRPLQDVFLYIQALGNSEGADSVIEYEIDKLIAGYGPVIIPATSKMLLRRATFSLGYKFTIAHSDYLLNTMSGSAGGIKNLPEEIQELKYKVGIPLIRFFSKYTWGYKLAVLISSQLDPEKYTSIQYNKAEKIILAKKSQFQNMLFDEGSYANFHYSILYDLMAKKGNQFLKVLSSKDKTKSYIDSLDAYDSYYAKLYKRYLEASYDGIYGKPMGYYELDDLARYADTAIYRLFDLFEILNDNFGKSNPHLPVISIRMNRKLDSRPEHQVSVFKMNNELLYNTKKTYEAMVREYKFDPDGQADKGYRIKYMDDGAVDVLDLMANKKLNFDKKFYLIKDLSLVNEEQWKNLSREKMESNYQDRYALIDYAEILSKENKFDEARNILLKHAPYFQSANDLSYSMIMGTAAYQSLKLNLPEQANQDVEAAFKSFSGFGLIAKANVLEALGQFSEAEEVIKSAIKRYPGSHLHTDHAKFLLLQGKSKEAIDVLHRAFNPSFGSINFLELGVVLVKVSKLKKDFDIHDFLTKLFKNEDFLFNLGFVAQAFSKDGQHDLALEIATKHQPVNLKFDYNILSYRYEENWVRFTEAEKPYRLVLSVLELFDNANRFDDGISFIKAKVGEKYIPYIFFTFHSLKSINKKQLFKSITDKNDSVSQFAALYYASYFIMHESHDINVRQSLMDYFSDPTINSFYYKMGRFLLTGEEHQKVVELAKTERRQISLFYFTGTYYNSINELKVANDWYQAGIFEGTYSFERSWIIDELDSWKKTNRSFRGILKMRKENLERISKAEGFDLSQGIVALDKAILAH